jgi:hypothetical protein
LPGVAQAATTKSAAEAKTARGETLDNGFNAQTYSGKQTT